MKRKLQLIGLMLIGAGALNAQTYFTEGFESTTGTALPTGWTKSQAALNTTSGWESGTALNSQFFPIPAHTRYMAVNDDVTQTSATSAAVDNGNDLLMTPTINLSASSFPVVTFDLLYYASANPAEVGTVEISLNGGTTWTVVSTFGGLGTWRSTGASIPTGAGQASVMIGFRYNDGGGWAYGMAVDNVTVMEAPSKEVAVTGITMPQFALLGAQSVVTTMTSHGGPTVASATLKYSVDGAAPVSQTFSPNIGYGGSYNATFTTQANLTAGVHKIKSWVSDVNGTGPDATLADDTAMCQISVLPGAAPAKNVVVEEFTGVGCGYCPQGAVTFRQAIASDPNIIWAAIHETGQGPDNMNIPDGTTITAAYDQGDPSYSLDRSYMTNYAYNCVGVQNTALMDITPISPRESVIVPATVSLSNVSIDGTRKISATVTANFVGAVEGTYALNCYIIENRVYGPTAATTDNGWNEHSYWYANNLSDYFNIGSVSAPWSANVAGLFPNIYQHEHVVEQFLGGPWGDATVIPTTLVTAGSTYSKTFTWTLPAGNTTNNALAHRYNADNISIIGLVEEYSSTGDISKRAILNAVQQKLNTNPETGITGINGAGVEELATDFGTVAVYPNPFNSTTTLNLNIAKSNNVTVSIYNTFGQLVSSKNEGKLPAGENIITIDGSNLSTGIYLMNVTVGDKLYSQKITVSK